MKSRFIYFISIIMVFIFFAGCENKIETVNQKPQETDKQKLLKNLKDAYTGETTAKAKYEAYSKKAREDGFVNIAKLLEAISVSEGIHAKNHKEILEKIGEKAPEVKPEFTVKTSKENIDDAIKQGVLESTTLYPEFKKVSAALGDYGKDASNSFEFVIRTIPLYKAYLEEVIKAIDSKKVDKLASDYWICPVCGNIIFNEKDKTKCSICKNEKEPWIKL